jgi:hypothetical protein
MTITIKENALQGDHYVGSITTDTTLDSLFKEAVSNKPAIAPLFSIMVTTKNPDGLRLNFNDLESFKKLKDGNASAKDMMKNLLRYGKMAKYYIDDNSFLEMETKYVDNYLLQESIQWKGVKDFADDEYIEIVLEIDGSTNATDNYTGINVVKKVVGLFNKSIQRKRLCSHLEMVKNVLFRIPKQKNLLRKTHQQVKF